MIREANPVQFEIHWQDRFAEPKVKPNPAYPQGIDVDGSAGAEQACRVALAYPARRIGFYHIRCKLCGFRLTLTTAGRPDDPRSVAMPCNII